MKILAIGGSSYQLITNSDLASITWMDLIIGIGITIAFFAIGFGLIYLVYKQKYNRF